MFFKAIVICFLLLIGAGFFNASAQSVQQASATAISENTYIVYVWIDGVRWAFVYSEDGRFLGGYPDPIL